MMPRILLLKAHVKSHTRKDGTFVHDYWTKTPAAKKKPAAGQKGLFGHKPLPAGAAPHPLPDDHGEKVMIHHPSKPTPPKAWSDPDAAVTVVPGGKVPADLNGVPFAPWDDHPTTDEGWEYADGVDDNLDEPPLHVPAGKHISAGVVIEEPDGRVWLTAPTNAFGGYRASFPKGTAEPEMSLQATALKETFEETGLKVRITGFLGDYTRTTSVARLYRAVRVGGSPADMGWESQACHLCPKDKLYDFLNLSADHSIAEDIGAGAPPKSADPKSVPSKAQSSLFDFDE